MNELIEMLQKKHDGYVEEAAALSDDFLTGIARGIDIAITAIKECYEWRCVKDNPPPRMKKVLVMVDGDVHTGVFGRCGWYIQDDSIYNRDVTHWRHLPPPAPRIRMAELSRPCDNC